MVDIFAGGVIISLRESQNRKWLHDTMRRPMETRKLIALAAGGATIISGAGVVAAQAADVPPSVEVGFSVNGQPVQGDDVTLSSTQNNTLNLVTHNCGYVELDFHRDGDYVARAVQNSWDTDDSSSYDVNLTKAQHDFLSKDGEKVFTPGNYSITAACYETQHGAGDDDAEKIGGFWFSTKSPDTGERRSKVVTVTANFTDGKGDATAAPSSSASAEPSESPSASAEPSESASPSEEPSAPADDETVTPLPDPSVDPEDTPSADPSDEATPSDEESADPDNTGDEATIPAVPSDEATPSDEESVDSGSTGDEATIPATSEATQAADNAPAASLGGASAGTIALPRTGN